MVVVAPLSVDLVQSVNLVQSVDLVVNRLIVNATSHNNKTTQNVPYSFVGSNLGTREKDMTLKLFFKIKFQVRQMTGTEQQNYSKVQNIEQESIPN